jgi:dCMP deaminase
MTEKWDRRFLKVARDISTWSKDPSTKVGAVAVGPNREMRAQGYNGFPRGVTDSPERYNDREIKYRLIVHAELNTCLHAARIGVPLEGCDLYVTLPPCSVCAGALIQVGFRNVITIAQEIPDRWKEDFERGQNILAEAGVGYRYVELP